MKSPRPGLVGTLAVLITLGSVAPVRAQGKAEDDRDQPHDLILAVDVSLSMIMKTVEGKKEFPPSDRAGIRWDGIQFSVDVARDQDRIALVLYRAENVVVTRFLDRSGFVQMSKPYPEFGGRTGRELLSQLLVELQKQEKKWADEIEALERKKQYPMGKFQDFHLPLLAGVPREKFRMAHGTASLLTLREIEQRLLPQLRPKALAWVFLFTDGAEMARYKDDGSQYPFSDYDYIARRKGLTGKRLEAWVEPWVRVFRAKKVPILTFGLGDACDHPLLESVGLRSSAPDRPSHRGASYRYGPGMTLKLLNDLRHIQWELSEYWTHDLAPERRDRGQEIFRTPKIGIWRDMGLLLYRLRTGESQRAYCPLKEHMSPPAVGGRPLPALVPREGRSYWYYSLSPSAPALAQASPEAQLRLLVSKDRPPHEKYQTHCVAALQPRGPLFRYVGPAPDGRTYTPRDAIPFEVEFHPYALPARTGQPPEIPFRAEDFEVQVTLTRPARDGTAAAKPFARFKLQRDEPNPADPLAARRFAYDLVLDSNPNAHGDPALTGLYFVDIEIVGIEAPGRRDANPLKGAVRRLIRRTLQVGPYPRLKLAPGPIVLGNDGSGALAAEVRLELDMPTDPTAPRAPAKPVQTNVRVALGRGPVLGKDVIEPGLFRITPTPLALRGKAGSFRVTLPAEALSGRAEGDYEGGTLSVQAPWQKVPTALELVVRRRAYTLRVTPPRLRLDLSARGKSKDPPTLTLKAELETNLDVREKVWLSASDSLEAPASGELEFAQLEDGLGNKPAKPAVVRFRTRGIGPGAFKLARGTEDPEKASLPFTLEPQSKLQPGLYRRTLYLVGPGVKTVPVSVTVAVNEVSVKDSTGKTLDQLSLLGLAGTEVSYTVGFRSALAARPVKKVTVRPGWEPLRNLSPGGWDRLPLRVKESAGDARQVAVALSVPRCVQEGGYETSLTFEISVGESDEAQRLQVSLPVYVEVRHTGVRFLQKELERGALWLRFPEGKTDSESAPQTLTLLSDAEAPVRWSVERVAAKAPGLGTTLKPDDGRLHVLFKGSSVLPAPGETGKDPELRGGPRDPLRSGSPCRLTVRASRKGLAPGLYRTVLRFHSREDRPDAGAGQANELTVYVVVPGCANLTAARADARPLYLGDEALVRVEVAAHDRDPGQGMLRPLDGKGNSSGPGIPLTRPEASTPDPAVPGKIVHRYLVKAAPRSAGKNAYEVRWPRFHRGEGPAEDVLKCPLTLAALGVIEVKQRVVGVNENVFIRATIDPAQRPQGDSPLVLHLLDRSDRTRDPVEVELHDTGKPEDGDERAGDGIYSARYPFTSPGTYEIVAPKGGEVGPLRPAEAHVNYEFRYPDRLGTIEYGSGDWLRWLGISEELSAAQAIQLSNRRPERCRWRARLLFPKGAMEAHQVTERNVGSVPAGPEADPRVHLDARLTGPGAAEAGPGWTLGGVLQQDQEVELGVESKLSQPALDEAYGHSAAGAAPHPALGKSSALILEVELEWLDDQGQVVERRTLRAPLAVATRHWTMNPKPWILGGGFLVGLYILSRVLLRRIRGGQRPTEPAPEAAAVSAPVSEQPRAAPPPRLAPPRLAGDDDLPEHMR
jgi:hypothetical protein